MATESARIDFIMGNRRAVEATLASISNADTWKPGLGLVQQVILTSATASAGQFLGATFSGGTVTFLVEGGTPTARVTAMGY